jgi:MFS family permease
MTLLDPARSSYRFVILAFNCLLTLGSYYAFDMPSVLQNELVSQVIMPFSPNGAQTLYNAWYTAYAWCNMCMSLFAGVLVDRWGTSKCSVLFLSLIIFGQSVFTLGAFLAPDHATTPLPYAVMFAGRLIFGLGGGPITIVQNTIAARWFTGKELAFAFGVSLTVSRLGSVINYDLTTIIFNKAQQLSPGFGLAYTFVFGLILCCCSMLAAAVYVALERRALAAGHGPSAAGFKPKIVKFSDVRELPTVYWLIVVVIVSFYCDIFPFQAVIKSYFTSGQWPFLVGNSQGASVRSSIVYTISMAVSPFMGGIIDYFGRRTWWLVLGCTLLFPVFSIFAFGGDAVDPYAPMVILGIGYSIVAAALWPSIALVVPGTVVGTANGIATSVQMLGVGICNLATGAIVDAAGYPALMKMFLGFACVATLGGETARPSLSRARKHSSACSDFCHSYGQGWQVERKQEGA